MANRIINLEVSMEFVSLGHGVTDKNGNISRHIMKPNNVTHLYSSEELSKIAYNYFNGKTDSLPSFDESENKCITFLMLKVRSREPVQRITSFTVSAKARGGYGDASGAYALLDMNNNTATNNIHPLDQSKSASGYNRNYMYKKKASFETTTLNITDINHYINGYLFMPVWFNKKGLTNARTWEGSDNLWNTSYTVQDNSYNARTGSTRTLEEGIDSGDYIQPLVQEFLLYDFSITSPDSEISFKYPVEQLVRNQKLRLINRTSDNSYSSTSKNKGGKAYFYNNETIATNGDDSIFYESEIIVEDNQPVQYYRPNISSNAYLVNGPAIYPKIQSKYSFNNQGKYLTLDEGFNANSPDSNRDLSTSRYKDFEITWGDDASKFSNSITVYNSNTAQNETKSINEFILDSLNINIASNSEHLINSVAGDVSRIGDISKDGVNSRFSLSIDPFRSDDTFLENEEFKISFHAGDKDLGYTNFNTQLELWGLAPSYYARYYVNLDIDSIDDQNVSGINTNSFSPDYVVGHAEATLLYPIYPDYSFTNGSVTSVGTYIYSDEISDIFFLEKDGQDYSSTKDLFQFDLHDKVNKYDDNGSLNFVNVDNRTITINVNTMLSDLNIPTTDISCYVKITGDNTLGASLVGAVDGVKTLSASEVSPTDILEINFDTKAKQSDGEYSTILSISSDDVTYEELYTIYAYRVQDLSINQFVLTGTMSDYSDYIVVTQNTVSEKLTCTFSILDTADYINGTHFNIIDDESVDLEGDTIINQAIEIAAESVVLTQIPVDFVDVNITIGDYSTTLKYQAKQDLDGEPFYKAFKTTYYQNYEQVIVIAPTETIILNNNDFIKVNSEPFTPEYDIFNDGTEYKNEPMSKFRIEDISLAECTSEGYILGYADDCDITSDNDRENLDQASIQVKNSGSVNMTIKVIALCKHIG